jgi:hypothetical protein
MDVDGTGFNFFTLERLENLTRFGAVSAHFSNPNAEGSIVCESP